MPLESRCYICGTKTGPDQNHSIGNGCVSVIADNFRSEFVFVKDEIGKVRQELQASHQDLLDYSRKLESSLAKLEGRFTDFLKRFTKIEVRMNAVEEAIERGGFRPDAASSKSK